MCAAFPSSDAMEAEYNGRQHQWKMTSMKDALIRRRPHARQPKERNDDLYGSKPECTMSNSITAWSQLKILYSEVGTAKARFVFKVLSIDNF